MSDQVIVTLCYDQKETDYALPAKTQLRELYPRLLAVLIDGKSDTFQRASGVCLQREDGYLTDLNATLLDYGVKNGARLTVSMEG